MIKGSVADPGYSLRNGHGSKAGSCKGKLPDLRDSFLYLIGRKGAVPVKSLGGNLIVPHDGIFGEILSLLGIVRHQISYRLGFLRRFIA